MKKIEIITHNGKFHADDVCAVAVLKIWIEKNGSKNFFGETKIEIIRTRDADIIKSGDIAVDVGGIYNPAKFRFDHHQNGLGKRLNGIPYAAFGLVWKEYGEEICGSPEIAEEIDARIIQSIDALDNGVNICEPVFPNSRPYLFSDTIDAFNFLLKGNEESLDKNFLAAVDLTKNILEREIKKARAEIKEKELIKKIYEQTEDKRIIILDRYYSDSAWQKTLEKYPEPIYVVRTARENKLWQVRAIKKMEGSFESCRDLPKKWAGEVDAELVRRTGVPDAIFCHNKRFIAVARSKEGALKLARLALK
ncbi:MAG: MYG1 family protein [Candidatus Pacebacteria bacterium]|nr:MYG1 family protein [Candidatus Paceibacterota bacterium]